MLFDRAGIASVPYPMDFKSTCDYSNWMSLVPSAGALYLKSEAVRELIGRLCNRLMFAFDK